MIARRIRMNAASKSRCTHLIQYLIDTQGHESRVQDVRITNCDSEDPEWAGIEMLATQRQNTTARGDKTYHLVLSFHEYPNANTLKAIEDTLCSALGFEGHQRLSVLHGDTDNLHLHVVINKIHPEKLTIHEPYYDHKTLASQCVRLEHAFNLVPDNHQPKAQAVETAAVNMEKAGDMESLIGWIQRTCLAELKTASSWEQVHEVLDQHGLKLKERGNGFTLSSGTLHVKPSSVDRGLSRAALEKRLGAFQEAPCRDAVRGQTLPTSSREPAKGYTRQPLSHKKFDSSRLWERYSAELKHADQTRENTLREARAHRDAALQQAAKVANIRNFVIQYMVSGAVLKRIMRWQNRANMRKKQAEIRKNYLEKRGQAYAEHPRDTWNAWLVKQAENGNAESLAALRARNPVQPTTGNHITGVRRTDTASASALPMEKITRKGAQLFGGIRDTGDALLFTNMKPETLKKGLELAHERFRVLRVEGDEIFRKNVAQSARGMPVAFSDPVLEHIRREQLFSVQQKQTRETSRGR